MEINNEAMRKAYGELTEGCKICSMPIPCLEHVRRPEAVISVDLRHPSSLTRNPF